MSNTNQINPEVARLLQILSATTGTSLLPPSSNNSTQPSVPAPAQAPLSQPQLQWPPQQPQPTADPRLATADPRLAQFPRAPAASQFSNAAPAPTALAPQAQSQYPPRPQGLQQPAHVPQTYPPHIPQQQQQALKIDPSSITQWPAALRYVTTVIARDDLVMTKLRKMKKNQKDNELVWHLSRQELLKKQKARIEGNKQVDELLKQFSPQFPLTTTTTNNHLPSPSSSATEAAELHTFDLKVHKAASAMVNAMSVELGQLGIPFFSGGKGGTPRLKMGDDDDSNGEDTYGIEEEELRELRRRMMELVGDLVGE